MATWAIGDVQGCYGALQKLLQKIRFDPAQDTLWFAGDLVSRGEDSLASLRFIAALGERAKIVLGNHDLHLLALYHGAAPLRPKEHDLLPILQAEDAAPLMQWLIRQPLLVENDHYVMTHAGIHPLWDLPLARQLASELQQALATESPKAFFKAMYGNQPSRFTPELTGDDRLRVIINTFTRMRFINQQGELELESKGEADQAPVGFFPWFQHPQRQDLEKTLLFGHWAALQGKMPVNGIEALDTGCVWQGALTAFNLDSRQRVAVDCSCQGNKHV